MPPPPTEPTRPPATDGWATNATTGSAASFHDRLPADDTGPQVWIHTIERPAIVLGSTQPDDLVDHDRARADGIEVCSRRSGGGLVWIDPATDCWIDVIVPKGSGLWRDDIGTAFHWLGETWADVLRHFDIEATVHRTSASSPVGTVWCFADLGHGELSLHGSKILGLSQRRTRNWTRLQALVLGSWPGAAMNRYVDPAAMIRHRPERYKTLNSLDELDPALVLAGFPSGVTAPSPDLLIERFLASLPDPSPRPE